MKPLHKTTIVIWSDPEDLPAHAMDVDTLGAEAMDGLAYCSKQLTEVVENPSHDPDWDGTEFFDEDNEENDA